MTTHTTPPQTGILVSTSIAAGSDGREQNHAEGIVVSTALTAGTGNGGLATNHGEGIVG
jgi:hypothetical protein